MLHNLFFLLGKNKTQLAHSLHKKIDDSGHILYRYSNSLLTGIMDSHPEDIHSLCKEVFLKNDIEQARKIAESYANNTHTAQFTARDIKIVDALLAMEDEEIDFRLSDGLQGFQKTDPDWVAGTLLKLSNRISDRNFDTLLGHINPDNPDSPFNYYLWKTQPQIFKKIIFNTIRLRGLSNISYYLAHCLKEINKRDQWVVFKYFVQRTKYFRNHRDYNPYDIMEHFTFDLTFISENENYEKILNAVLGFAKKDLYNLSVCIDFLTCVWIKGDRLDYDKNEDLELDKTTLKVLAKWINQSHDDLLIVAEICRQITIWRSWFHLANQIVNRTSDKKTWANIRSALYLGSHSGLTSSFYQKRFELVQKQFQYFDSPPMMRFLKDTEKMFVEMIEREKEREQEEDI